MDHDTRHLVDIRPLRGDLWRQRLPRALQVGVGFVRLLFHGILGSGRLGAVMNAFTREQLPYRSSYRDELILAADAAQKAIWSNRLAVEAPDDISPKKPWMPSHEELAASARYYRLQCHRHLANAIGFASRE